MEIEKIFNDLESNQNHDSEEARKKLAEQFTLTKDQWLVHSMMEYYLKTGSSRIIEVLVKAQSPHDGYLFDRLADWLKTPSQRLHSLNLFCFVVRRHPTWLFKVEKHRLIRDMLHWLKQLEIEKEIVPLMSALLAIITLLPIIPSLVPNFLNDLFAVFAHLASWNNQHTARLSEDKLVHLQLGLQMLFHRLYGMFPCNFVAFLTDFIRKEKGAIFQHTIKPLLETVRLHPMLVTATVDSEMNSERWKDVQPHDVVVECMCLSLPMKYQDITNSENTANINNSKTNVILTAAKTTTTTTTTTLYQLSSTSIFSRPHYRETQQQRLTGNLQHSGSGSSSGIWSPYHEIMNASHTPLTPTPTPYMMPLSSSSATTIHSQGNLGGNDCSPPEAAVEATPETTPLKDNRDLKRPSLMGVTGANNPLAVRDLFASSQPSSPHRGKESLHGQHFSNYQQQQHFNFPDATSSVSATNNAFVEQELNSRLITRPNTNYDRKLQQILQDRRQTQSPFQTIESLSIKTQNDLCRTPDIELTCNFAVTGCGRYPHSNSVTPLSTLTATPTPGSTPLPMPSISTPMEIPLTKVCDQCNETDQTMCTKGGLQMPTSRSMQLLAKGIKRRNRMTSYCYNETSCEKGGQHGNNCCHKIRRTKSLSSLYLNSTKTSQTSGDNSDSNEDDSIAMPNERPLQKCPKMLAIASVIKNSSQAKPLMEDKSIQTLEAVPPQNNESSLIQMLIESKEYRTAYEACRRTPNEILEQFIVQGLRNNGVDRIDQEQFQLLCLQLQYERYRREIHAERNRRLMGRSRDKRSLEMERDRLKEQLKDFEMKNKELSLQLDKTKKATNEKVYEYQEELDALKDKYQNELEQNRFLRLTKENLETKLKEELSQRKDINYELEALRGQVFSLTTELQHAQRQAEMGLQCRQELARIEADFIVMGEAQIKCREKLKEMDNYRAKDEELHMLQETFNIELKDLKHSLDEKSSQLESARHKIQEMQSQIMNNEKVITDQKRILRAVKDEYEEKFKCLNRKYDIQKSIIIQMEEKFIMSLHKAFPSAQGNACHSPDTDKTDMASSIERNSPLSTSLASSESLSTSLKSSELRNLQQLVENPITEIGIFTSSTTTITGGINITDGQRMAPQTLDLASSANTATSMFNLRSEQNEFRSSSSTAAPATKSSASSSTSYATTIVTSSNKTNIAHMHSSIQPSTSKTYKPPPN